MKKIFNEVEKANLKLAQLKEKINSLCQNKDEAFNKNNIKSYNR